MTFVNFPVPVTVAEQPAAISGLLSNLFEEVRQRVLRTAQFFRDTAGRTVGDDIVYRPAVSVQGTPGLGIILLRGKFLRSPGLAHDPILFAALPEQTEEPFVIIRRGRVQNAVVDVMG